MNMNLYVKLSICLLVGLITLARADPCNRNNGGCDRRNGLCWGTGENTHFCTCKAGFKQDKSKTQHICIDIDECKEENPCDDNARCQNTYGSYRCNCKCGYVLDYTKQRCLSAFDITGMCIVPTRCYYHDQSLRFFMEDRDFSVAYSRDYMTDYRNTAIRDIPNDRRRNQCRCENGFTLNYCGYCVDTNECRGRHRCKGPRSTCTNTEGSYYCGCQPPYVLGPCKERCYHPRSVPDICRRPRTDVLNQQGFAYRTYNVPILLQNYRSCPDGVETGADTIEKYDLDHDNKDDVRLSWHCVDTPGDSVLKKYSEQEAAWGPWTCWTACKATCWGGVQTRMRECKHGLPSMEGCVGEGSQKRSCYSGKKCAFRIRKNAAKLSRRDIDDLEQAMKKYKEDETDKGFHNAASSHGWPFQCGNRESCCPHGARMKFVTWHRSITLNFEEGLSRYLKDKSLGIPYWDWLGENQGPPSWALQKQSAWANMTVLIDRTGPMRTIQRDSQIFTRALEFSKDTWVRVTSKKQKPHIMHEYAESLENIHGGPHVSVCGEGFVTDKCRISLGVLDFAAFDSLFLLHHSMVDRLWAITQKEMADRGQTTWTTQTALETLEENGDFGRKFEPFNNISLNSFPIVQATNTMRDAYYYEELTGIKYDSLPKNGLTGSQRALRLGGDERLFIGHFFRAARYTRINYYFVFSEDDNTPCSEFTEDSRVGTATSTTMSVNGVQHLPSRPNLVPMEKVGINTGNLDFDFILRACYTTNTTCQERCEEAPAANTLAQSDPMTILHIRNQPVDVYKFLWAEGRRLPSWPINMHSGSQWLYFYGGRRGNIVQVRTASEYTRCDGRQGRPFQCGTNEAEKACMLPTGVYFLVDSDQARCRAGLKMLIISRK